MTLPEGPVEELRADAWLGDAVLELYVRQWILRHHGSIDADMKTRFTCNSFLNSLGNPTRVEAAIGRIHQKEGLQAAWEWIQQHIEPHFLRQEAKKERRR
jgi:dsRNA-specific ribonuclease